jgi:glutathionylspermidine synthase
VQRHTLTPRSDWQRIVANQGLTWHSVEGRPYWDESAYWEFTAAEIDRLEAATAALQQMCLAAGDHVLEHDRLAQMHIPPQAAAAIRASWHEEPPSLYGRMDLAYDGRSIKLLEYNADTPTSLLEASVIQWRWLEDCFPGRDQWNSIHEKLVAKWRDLQPYLAQPVYFAHDGYEEDALTIAYLRDTATAAGLNTAGILMHDIGWNSKRTCFVDTEEAPIETLFKLYPWETLLHETFGPHALASIAPGQRPRSGRTQWIEPIWKMLWSNKALLAILWELYPDHDLLLPAYLDAPRHMDRYVQKPLFGREGANIRLVDGERSLTTGGIYGDGPWLYQGLAPVASVDGNWAVLGAWLVDGEPCGLGVREARTPIIRNTDRFVAHLF